MAQNWGNWWASSPLFCSSCLIFQGQAGTNNLINSPQMNPQGVKAAAFSRYPWIHRTELNSFPPLFTLTIESNNSSPNLLFLPMWYFKVALMVPAPRTYQTLWRAGPANGYHRRMGIPSKNTVTLLSPKTGWAWVPALKYKWWCTSFGIVIVFLHL